MSNKSDSVERKQKRVFKNFAEYWHFVKTLNEDQRRQIVDSLPVSEQKSLKASYDRGGWEDLFMRNACDYILSALEKQYGVDLLKIKCQVISGKQILVQKAYWQAANVAFDNMPWEHIAYIFDGIHAETFDEDYVKLSKYESSN